MVRNPQLPETSEAAPVETPKKRRRKKGEGSFTFDEKKQRWEASFKPCNGARQYVTGRQGESWKQFKARFDKAKRNAEAGLRPSKDTFASFLIETWLADVRRSVNAGEMSFRTLESYEDTVNRHLIPVIGHIKLIDLRRDDVKRAMNVAADAGYAVRTVNYIRSIATIALNAAMDLDLVERNVAARTKTEKARPQAFNTDDVYTADEIAAFTAEADKKRNGVMVTLAAYLGLRRGELLGLKWHDFDEQHATLFVQRQLQKRREDKALILKELKTTKSRRLLKLPAFLVEKLKAHRRAQREQRLRMGNKWRDEDLIFATMYGGRVDPRNAQRLHDDVLKAAGVRKRRMHDLRHTTASLQFEAGTHDLAVSGMLGHSSVRVTREVYGHVTRPMIDTAITAMEAIYESGKAKQGS